MQVRAIELVSVDDNYYVVEASQIGVQPGQEPDSLLHTDFGNQCPFAFERVDRHGGEVTGWRYRQLNSPSTLLVIND